MKDRIRKIISEKNLTNSEFSEQTGIPKSGLSHILSGRNKVSLDYVLKILKAFPEINTDWLLKGVKSEEKMTKPLSEKNENINELGESAKFKTENQKNKFNISAEKSIEKVIILYTDNTFETYINQ